MTDALVIRDAKAGDEESIVAALRDFAVFERLEHLFRLTPEIVRRDFFGTQRRVQCGIAEWDGAFAGLMVWFHAYATFRAIPTFFLEDIYVLPEFRRRGIAKQFLRHLAQEAVREGAGRIDWAVLDWNLRAIAFYESIGAPVVEGWGICRLQGEALARLAQ